jgi:TolB-like protein/Flp pilus assembly protein TadD
VTDHKFLVFRFGDTEVREREFHLIKAGEALQVEPKAFRVLLFLLRNSERLVTKEEILDAVWTDTAVSENSLTRSIATLRKLLGDDSREPRYIENVPRIGYRFLVEVEVAEDTTSAPTAQQVHTDYHSLAVLPFTNGTGPLEAEYLSEGISESIINLLSQFHDLRVVPRTSAFRYKGLDTELKKVARDLNVDAVLTGSVMQRGDKLIVQTELVDVAYNAQLWGSQYNRKLDDIFDLQEELARRIVESLRPRLAPEEEKFLATRPTENREAYHLYLKAMYSANQWTPEGIQKGIAYSTQAIAMDPLFARAYTGLAYLYSLVATFGSVPPLQAFPIAKAAALRALEIDDTLATAHAALAYILLAFDWDWTGADKESRRAIELAPNMPGGHYVRSQWCLAIGRSEEAIAEARRTLDLDPLSLPNYMNLAGTYHLLGQHDLAVEQLLKAQELDPSFTPARQLLALCYTFSGRYQEAMAEANEAAARTRGAPRADIRVTGIAGVINAASGRQDEARQALMELAEYAKPPDFIGALDSSYIHALLGEKDQALEWLEKAYQGHANTMFYIKRRPMFAILRDDPRFHSLLHRMGLPAHGETS